MRQHLPEYSPRLKQTPRMLRKNMTDTERKLCSRVRDNRLGAKFRRQIPLGPYNVDFYCAKARIVVKLDGSQHHTKSGLTLDQERDSYFASFGIKVLRYKNIDILKNIDGVVENILLDIEICLN